MSSMTVEVAFRACQYCGSAHAGTCPRITAIEYHDNGVTIKRVELAPLGVPSRGKTELRRLFDAWITARHDSLEMLGPNTVRLAELEALLAALVAEAERA